MPLAAPHPCNHPNCPQTVPHGTRWCPKHTTQHHRDDADRRGNFRQRGYSSRWDKVSLDHRRRNPLCAECLKAGRITPVLGVDAAGRPRGVTDHVVAWQSGRTPEERERLKWSADNLQSLCAACHGVKTAREDGAFGRGKVRP